MKTLLTISILFLQLNAGAQQQVQLPQTRGAVPSIGENIRQVQLLSPLSALLSPQSQQAPAQSLTSKKSLETIKLLQETIGSTMGNEGGHGGDPYALEFAELGTILAANLADGLSRLSSEDSADLNGLTADDLKLAVAKTRVVSKERKYMILNGQEVPGINFPEASLIKVNQDTWRMDSLEEKLELVLHEYLGILKIEQDTYTVSIHLAATVHQLAVAVAADPAYSDMMVNLFYGRCNAVPPLTSNDICESGSSELAKAEECARVIAEGQCRMSGKSNCQLIETTYNPVVSTDYIGVRYCEVQTIMK